MSKDKNPPNTTDVDAVTAALIHKWPDTTWTTRTSGSRGVLVSWTDGPKGWAVRSFVAKTFPGTNDNDSRFRRNVTLAARVAFAGSDRDLPVGGCWWNVDLDGLNCDVDVPDDLPPVDVNPDAPYMCFPAYWRTWWTNR